MAREVDGFGFLLKEQGEIADGGLVFPKPHKSVGLFYAFLNVFKLFLKVQLLNQPKVVFHSLHHVLHNQRRSKQE